MNLRGSTLRFAAAWLLALAFCASAFAQSDIKRETVAVTYPLDQTVSLKFRGTTRLPRLKGEAKVRRSGRRNTRVELEIENLPRAYELGSVYTTFVLWAISPEGRADNLGEIKRGGGRFVNSKIDVTTPLETFALIVTAEPPYPARPRPPACARRAPWSCSKPPRRETPATRRSPRCRSLTWATRPTTSATRAS